MSDRSEPLPGVRELGVLALLACAVFLPTALTAGFLNYDDDFFFGARNRDLAVGGLAHVWNPTATIANAYLPISHTSLWVDLRVFGGAAAVAHVHSLVLHVLGAWVLARLLARLGVSRWGAVAAAAVFLVHPALVESVSWVASRKDVLSGLFAFLCLTAVVRERRGAAAGWALLAVYSKATAIVLPLLALPIVWSRRPRRWGDLAVIAAIAALAGVHHTLVAAGEGTLVTTDPASRFEQLPGAFLHYLTTALWPSGTNIVYPEVATLESFRARALPGLVALAGVVGAIWALRARRPLAAAGLAAFVLALAPFNTALPASTAAAADRYLYLAIPGLALALVGLAPRGGPWLAAACAVVLAFVAARRADDFRDSETLWRASLARDPENAVAAINLASAVLERRPGALAEARELLERASGAARYPQHRLRAETMLVGVAEVEDRIEASVLHAARAVAALAEVPDAPTRVRVDVLVAAARQARLAGQPGRAEGWLDEARALAPDDGTCLAFVASARLGELVDEHGRVDAGAPELAEVRALLERAEANVTEFTAYDVACARAELAAATGESITSDKYYRRAIAVSPRRPEAHVGRAQLFLARGLFEGAEDAVREALRAGATDPRLTYLLGLALGGQGLFGEARRFYEAYLLRRPDDTAARRSLAALVASETMRDLYELTPEQLDERAARIEQLDPSNPKLPLVRAVASRLRRDMKSALVLLEAARAELGDEDLEVRRLYAQTLRDRGYELWLQGDRRRRACDLFVQFLEIAPGTDVETDAVENLLLQEWRRVYEQGQLALADGDLGAAGPALRRALELRPGDGQPRLQLGLLHYMRGGDQLEVALLEFRAYVADRRAHGRDASVGVLYEVQTLRRLERYEAALAAADAFLDARSELPVADESDLARVVEAREAVARRLGVDPRRAPK